MQQSYGPQWPAHRAAQLAHDGHRCQTCGITAQQLDAMGWPGLQVHHVNEGPPAYSAAYGRETIGTGALMTLCAECHDGITNSVRRQRYRMDHKRITAHEHEPAAPRTHTPEATRGKLENRPVDDDRHRAADLSQRPDGRSKKLLFQEA